MASERISYTGEKNAQHPLPELEALQAVIGTSPQEQFDLLALAEQQACTNEICGLSVKQQDTRIKKGTKRLPDGILFPLEEPAPRFEDVYAPRTNIAIRCNAQCENASKCDRRARSLLRAISGLVDSSVEAVGEYETETQRIEQEAEDKADKIINEAEVQAAAILDPAKEEAQRIKDEASKQAQARKEEILDAVRSKVIVSAQQ